MLAQVEATHEPDDKTADNGTTGKTKKKPFSLIRTFVLADVITIGNAVSGAGATWGS